MKKKGKIFLKVVISLIFILIVYIAFCFIYKHVRYGKWLEKTGNGYQVKDEHSSDDHYNFHAWVTDNIFSTRGNLNLSEPLASDEKGRSLNKGIIKEVMIFPKIFTRLDVRINLNDNGMNVIPDGLQYIRLRFNEKLELLDSEGKKVLDKNGDTVEARTFRACREDIYSLVKNAHEVWGIFDLEDFDR